MKTYTATMKDGGQISFVVSRSLNRAMFVGKDLLAVGADRIYQLRTLENQPIGFDQPGRIGHATRNGECR